MAVSNGKRTADIIFKSLFAAISASGLAANIVAAAEPLKALNLLAYFTIQSNLIVLGVILYGLSLRIRNKPEGTFFAAIRNGATLWILVTGLVFHFMLSPLIHATGFWQYAIIVLHYVTPMLVLVNWIVFEEKGKVRYPQTLWWLLYPLFYLVVTEIRPVIDGFYPYWFLNPFKAYPAGIGSWGGVLIAVAVLFTFFGLLGLGLIAIDRKLKGKTVKA